MNISFSIPADGELLVKEGDSVDFTTPLVKIGEKQQSTLEVAKSLGMPPKKIFQNLKKFVGEEVKKGDLLVESSSFLSKKAYYSELDGTIKEINHNEGVIIVETQTISDAVLNCFFKGEIASIDKRIIHLKVHHAKEFELKQASDHFGGPVICCTDPIKGNLSEEEVMGKVVFDDTIPSYEQIKYEALGARGFVSLHSLTEESAVPFAKMKDVAEYEKVCKQPLPYCIVDKTNNKMYVYE